MKKERTARKAINRKRFLAVILICALAAGVPAISVQAAKLKTVTCNLSLQKKSAKASCTVIGTGYDRLYVNLCLQKYKNKKWVTIKSQTANTRKASLSVKRSGQVSKGRFRARASVTVQKGKKKQTHVYYSSVRTVH